LVEDVLLDNSDDVPVAISAAETNPPDKVDVFALLYLSLHMSSRSLVGVGEEPNKCSPPALAMQQQSAELLERGENARSLWNLESRLLPVAINSNILGIAHLGTIRS
jgi:hypothetical protein